MLSSKQPADILQKSNENVETTYLCASYASVLAIVNHKKAILLQYFYNRFLPPEKRVNPTPPGLDLIAVISVRMHTQPKLCWHLESSDQTTSANRLPHRAEDNGWAPWGLMCEPTRDSLCNNL